MDSPLTIPPTWVRGGAIPLSKAARFAGVSTKTFRRWLKLDCNLITRKGSPGQIRLVLVDDVERVIQKRLMSKRYVPRYEARRLLRTQQPAKQAEQGVPKTDNQGEYRSSSPAERQ